MKYPRLVCEARRSGKDSVKNLTLRKERNSLLNVCQTFAWILPATVTITLTKWPQAAATVTAAAFTGYAPWKRLAVGMNKIGSVRVGRPVNQHGELP